MDTSDPAITFDHDGVCSHCHAHGETIREPSYVAKRQAGALQGLVTRIQRAGRRKDYDCIIGVSGGSDSTYCAYMVKKLGLRPLAVHMDNGWNSELAVSNIEKTLRKLDIDLRTHVLDWEEFRDLQLAFLKASTPDSEIPTDHAILAVLYEMAASEGVEYILSGHSTATEGQGVAAWSQGHGDWKYIRSVNRAFGSRTLRTFPHYGPFRFLYYAVLKRIKWVPILDYLDYDKSAAMEVITNELGWVYYGGKHYESVYTRFFQGYLLPQKFGFDKRRMHLAALIRSGQMSRSDALAALERNDYPSDLLQRDRDFVLKKLGLSEPEFDEIMRSPKKSFWDFPSYKKNLQRWPRLISAYHRLKRH